MHSLNNIDRTQINNQLMIKLFHLYEEKGKAANYKELFSKDEQILANEILETNIEQIAHYLEFDLTPARIKLMANIKKDYASKNKEEILYNNLKELFLMIHNSKEKFYLSVNEIVDMATVMFRGYDNVFLDRSGRSSTHKLIIPFEKQSKSGQLEELVKKYNDLIKEDNHELLQIILNFYVDFIHVKPFNKENDLIALLTIYTILYNEFQVCRYDSFFKELLKQREAFKASIVQSSYNWNLGYSQIDSLITIITNILLKMHQNLKEKEHIYAFDVKMNKQDNIEGIIMDGPDVFTKSQIRKKAPLASESTINRTLQILRQRNVIVPLGKGRSAKWQRVTEKKKRFLHEQLSLFDNK